MANKSINALDNTSTLDNADLLVLWKSSANAAYNISGQDFTAMLTALASGHGGIASINYTAPVPPSLDGTLTITLADGDVNSFTIKNGAKGDTGDQTYVWFAFSSVEPTSDADVSVIPGPWMGFYAGLEDTQANLHYTDYTWYEIKGPKGDGVSYTVLSSTVGLTKTYTMYTAGGTAVGTFSVTDGEGAVSTVNGIGADGNGDVPVTVSSVADLELSGTPLVVGSATIADAYAALQDKQVLICPASDFATGELPLVNGNRINDGTIEIVKGDGTDGWIEFHGRQNSAGDYRMFFTSADVPSGTWVWQNTAVASGSVSAESGYTVSDPAIKRTGMICSVSFAISGSSIPNAQTIIATIADGFRPAADVETAVLATGSYNAATYKAKIFSDGRVQTQGNGTAPAWINIVATYICS